MGHCNARALLSALDAFLAGKTHSLTIVRVRAVEPKHRLSQSRIRESLQPQLKPAAQRGHGAALKYGCPSKVMGWYTQVAKAGKPRQAAACNGYSFSINATV